MPLAQLADPWQRMEMAKESEVRRTIVCFLMDYIRCGNVARTQQVSVQVSEVWVANVTTGYRSAGERKTKTNIREITALFNLRQRSLMLACCAGKQSN